MRKNNFYLDKLIRRAIMEQDEAVPPPPAANPAAGEEDVPPPPTTSQVTYRIVGSDGNTDPNKYTLDQLKTKNLTADSLVYTKSLGDWKKVKDVPELSSLITPATPANKTTETTDTDVAAAEGFFKYCPNVAKIMKSASETLLSNYTKSINAVTDPAEQERLKAEAYEKMAESNKNDLKSCETEFKSSKTMTNADKENVLSQYRSTINNLLRKTAADLGKQALVGGVNLATKLITKKIGGTQQPISNAVAEGLIKKNTKNHLIEIYNRKNRRRY